MYDRAWQHDSARRSWSSVSKIEQIRSDENNTYIPAGPQDEEKRSKDAFSTAISFEFSWAVCDHQRISKSTMHRQAFIVPSNIRSCQQNRFSMAQRLPLAATIDLHGSIEVSDLSNRALHSTPATSTQYKYFVRMLSFH